MRKIYEASYIPLDVGFNLKFFPGICIAVPPGAVTIHYEDRKGKKKTFSGNATEAVRKLKASGLCAIVKRHRRKHR